MSNKPAVCHIAPYYPPHVGGLQESIKNLANAQAQSGRSVTVITSKIPKSPAPGGSKRLKILRLRTIELAHVPLMPGLFFTMLRKINRSDIAHLHFAQPYLPEVTLLWHFIRRRPYVFHFHGDVLPSGRLGGLLKPYKKYILPITLKRAAIVVFPSKDFCSRMTDIYPFLKSVDLRVIPNGINMPDQKSRKKNNPEYFLYVGRLAKIKEVPFIIEAFHLARKETPNIKLLVAGSGECETELKDMVSHYNEEDAVQFIGDKSSHELDGLYEKAIAVLVASRRESFGMTIAEAMSHGVPVIACKAPGVREMIEDGVDGHLLARDEKSYAKTIAHIANNLDFREQLSVRALKSASGYDLKKIVKRFDDIYKEIM